MAPKEKTECWNTKAWLQVLLFSCVIFATIPLARTAQRFIHENLGSEFFTYAVLFIIVCALIIVLYFFHLTFKVNKLSQYVWLVVCAGILVSLTVSLSKHPEEAVHVLEYGILTYFIFNALSYKIKDWTIYLDTLLIVFVVGTADELIQWIVPERVGSYKDIAVNTLAGLIFTIAISRGIRPANINQSANRNSAVVLAKITAAALIVLGISLSIPLKSG